MRLWPFGKGDEESVEYVSRVVGATTKDGVELRGKLTLHFTASTPAKDADDVGDRGASALAAIMGGTASNELLGNEAALAQRVLPLVAILRPIRSAELVALHVVGGVASEPPPPRRTPSAPPPAHRRSSSQILAVRDGRLFPLGATPEIAGGGLVPLLRDSAARVLVGTLRAYDLVVVRALDVEDDGALSQGSFIPVSTAAPGKFAEERAGEIERWRERLGDLSLAALTGEAATVVCFFLGRCLESESVDTNVATRIVSSAAPLSFAELTPLADLPRYLVSPSDATLAYVTRVLAIVGADARAASGLVTALAPVLSSVQEEFFLAAGQVKLSNLKV